MCGVLVFHLVLFSIFFFSFKDLVLITDICRSIFECVRACVYKHNSSHGIDSAIAMYSFRLSYILVDALNRWVVQSPSPDIFYNILKIVWQHFNEGKSSPSSTDRISEFVILLRIEP